MEESQKECIDRNQEMFRAIDEISNRTNKAIISKWSSATFWGFGMAVEDLIELTFPRGYNMKLDARFKRIQRSGERYSQGIKYIPYQGKKIKIYRPERTLVELIKDAQGIYDETLLKSIKYFFKNIKYSPRELTKWAKIFKIPIIVSQFEAISKSW